MNAKVYIETSVISRNCREESKMKNEILEEVHKIKDAIAAENDFNIDRIARSLQNKEKRHKKNMVNFSKKDKKAA